MMHKGRPGQCRLAVLRPPGSPGKPERFAAGDRSGCGAYGTREKDCNSPLEQPGTVV